MFHAAMCQCVCECVYTAIATFVPHIYQGKTVLYLDTQETKKYPPLAPRTLVPFLLAVQSWLSFSSSFSSFSDGGGGGGSRCQRRTHIYKSRSKEKEREMVIISPADCHPLAFYTILSCKGTNPPTNPLDVKGRGVAGRLANEKTEKRPNTPI